MKQPLTSRFARGRRPCVLIGVAGLNSSGKGEVILSTASVDCLMRGRNCWNSAGSWLGRPSLGSRACRCKTVAPASEAAIALAAISSGVTGMWGDMDGV